MPRNKSSQVKAYRTEDSPSRAQTKEMPDFTRSTSVQREKHKVQVDVETVIGEAIGLLGSVEGRFGFGDRLRLVLLVLQGDELGALRKAEFATKEQKQSFRAIRASGGVREEA